MTKLTTIPTESQGRTVSVELPEDLAAALEQIATFRGCAVEALIAEGVAIHLQALSEEVTCMAEGWRKRAEEMCCD